MILCMLSKLYLCLFQYFFKNFNYLVSSFLVLFLFFWRGCGWFGSHCWSPAISGGQSCPHSSANYLLLLKLPIFHYFNRSRKHIAKTYLESQKSVDFPQNLGGVRVYLGWWEEFFLVVATSALLVCGQPETLGTLHFGTPRYSRTSSLWYTALWFLSRYSHLGTFFGTLRDPQKALILVQQ